MWLKKYLRSYFYLCEFSLWLNWLGGLALKILFSEITSSIWWIDLTSNFYSSVSLFRKLEVYLSRLVLAFSLIVSINLSLLGMIVKD